MLPAQSAQFGVGEHEAVTLGELRGLLRLTLASASAWPDATLDRWIQSAIRLYSEHFPRRYRATLTLEAGTQAYAVPGGRATRGGLDVAGVISVEYPAGDTPPRFLVRVTEASALFGAGGRCYALRGVAEDDGSGSPSLAAGYLVFAEAVADGEKAVVEYWGPHSLPAVGDDTAVITVPQQHLEAITAYVEFAAHYELETDEACVTDGSTIILAQLGEESRRAWNRYKEVMDRLVYLGRGETLPQPVWGNYGL
jgi:hypothetical protein